MAEDIATRSYRPDPMTPEQELVSRWIAGNIGDLKEWLAEILSRPENVNFLGPITGQEFDLIASTTLRGLYEKAYSGILTPSAELSDVFGDDVYYTEFIVTVRNLLAVRRRP